MNLKEQVRKYDPAGQFDILKNSYTQIEYAWNNKYEVSSLAGSFNKIIVSGLGGSAIGGDLIREYGGQDLKIPYFVNRNYFLPPYADNKTLIIISSYSGNTEETVSVLNQAIKLKAKIICISTGGKVQDIALEHKLPLVTLQTGFQPRYALGLGFFTLLKILQLLKVLREEERQVRDIIALWREKGEEYASETALPYQFSQKLIGFIPIIYSAADITSAAGYRFKCQFNENSKIHAFHNVIPELNHNEIIGWETFNEKQFCSVLINLLDESYPEQIKKRFTITSGLANKNGVDVLELKSDRTDFKTRLMDLIYTCDWITYYTAVLRGIDPTEIRNINILKERLV